MAKFFAKKDATDTRIKLPPGSPGRRKKVQTVNQLLNFCRDKLEFEDRWQIEVGFLACFGLRPWALSSSKWRGTASASPKGSSQKQSAPCIRVGLDSLGIKGLLQQLVRFRCRLWNQARTRWWTSIPMARLGIGLRCRSCRLIAFHHLLRPKSSGT